MEKYTSLKQDLSNEHKELFNNNNYLKKHTQSVDSVASVINIITNFYYIDNEGQEILKKISMSLSDELVLELANIFIHKYRVSQITRNSDSNIIKWYQLNAENVALSQKELDMGINLLSLYDKTEDEVKGYPSLLLIGELVKRKKLGNRIQKEEKNILVNNEKLLAQFDTNQRKLLTLFKLYGFTNEELKEIFYNLFLKRKEVYKNKDQAKYNDSDEHYRDGSLWGSSIEIMAQGVNNLWQIYKSLKDNDILVFINKELNILESNLKEKENTKNRYSNTRLIEKIKESIESSSNTNKNLLDFVKNAKTEVKVEYKHKAGKSYVYTLNISDLIDYQRVKYKSITARKMVVSSIKKLMKELGNSKGFLKNIKVEKEKGNLDNIKIIYVNKSQIEEQLLFKILDRVFKYVFEESIFKPINSDNVNSIIEKIYMEEELLKMEKREVKKAKILKF